MKVNRIGACIAALVFGFFLIAAVSECEARDPRIGELYPEPPLPSGICGIPRMSPDGSYIVFPDDSQRNPSGMISRIFSVYTDGSRMYQIPDGPSAPEYFLRDGSPDISPDGSRVVYSTFRHSTGVLWNRVHSYEIATAKPDGSDVKRLTRNEYDDRSPVWSPDGSRIAFKSSRGTSPGTYTPGIYTMNSDGSDVRLITTRHVTTGYGPPYPTLVWSPDGQHIAFRNSDGGEWDRESRGFIGAVYFVAIVGSDGLGFRRIMESDSLISEPVWSPEGQHLAFLTTEDKMLTLYIVDADGSNLQQVVATPVPQGGGSPTLIWSPDGQHIAFMKFDDFVLEETSLPGIHFVAIVGSNGLGFRRITESDSPTSEPVWSPDGRRLAFLMAEDNSVALYIADKDGSNLRRVIATSMSEPPLSSVTTTPYNQRVSWSPDSSEILIRYSYGLKNFMHSVRPDGSGFHTLREGVYGHERVSGSAMSVDSSRVIVYNCSNRRDGQVVLYTTALDGSDKRILVRSAHGELVAENSGWRDDVPTCSNGGAVSDPGDDPGLVQDCETLLSIRDTLSGEGVELNWQAYTPIEDWWGINIGGSPRRVEGLGYPKPIGVELRGTIPPKIGDLTGLKSIWLGGTQLTGPIPPELGDLAFLEMLWLAKNQLSGSIPAELGKLANLKDLHLQFNALTGEIPAELGNLENLQELYLHSNNLSGCIPSTIRLSRPKFSVDAGLEPC